MGIAAFAFRSPATQPHRRGNTNSPRSPTARDQGGAAARVHSARRTTCIATWPISCSWGPLGSAFAFHSPTTQTHRRREANSSRSPRARAQRGTTARVRSACRATCVAALSSPRSRGSLWSTFANTHGDIHASRTTQATAFSAGTGRAAPTRRLAGRGPIAGHEPWRGAPWSRSSLCLFAGRAVGTGRFADHPGLRGLGFLSHGKIEDPIAVDELVAKIELEPIECRNGSIVVGDPIRSHQEQ
jgi:hypothetical protein